MTLRQQQSLFLRLLPRLIDYAYAQGYELTLGEAWRTPEQAAINARNGSGIRSSLHGERLAIDLNLFRDGRYLSSSESHRPLGEFWESLHPLCRWGGRFRDSRGNPKPDGNHYSIAWNGRA